MKRARLAEEQIIAVLGEQGAGAKTADLARKQGVAEATRYNWKARFGGMDVSEAKRLKQLEDENAKLKKPQADQMLDAVSMRGLLSKNGSARRQARAVVHLRAVMDLSERRPVQSSERIGRWFATADALRRSRDAWWLLGASQSNESGRSPGRG